jgi:hypothetical protein
MLVPGILTIAVVNIVLVFAELEFFRKFILAALPVIAVTQ